jgi:hypothetical protein
MSELSSCSNNYRIQQNSATALATVRYSASALDQDTVGCHLEDHDTRSRTPRIRSASPVHVAVRNKLRRRRSSDGQAMINGASNVSKYPPDHSPMRMLWCMHVKTDLLDGVRNVWARECQILQCTCDAAVGQGVVNGSASLGGELCLGVHGLGARLQCCMHAHWRSSSGVRTGLDGERTRGWIGAPRCRGRAQGPQVLEGNGGM